MAINLNKSHRFLAPFLGFLLQTCSGMEQQTYIFQLTWQLITTTPWQKITIMAWDQVEKIPLYQRVETAEKITQKIIDLYNKEQKEIVSTQNKKLQQQAFSLLESLVQALKLNDKYQYGALWIKLYWNIYQQHANILDCPDEIFDLELQKAEIANHLTIPDCPIITTLKNLPTQ